MFHYCHGTPYVEVVDKNDRQMIFKTPNKAFQVMLIPGVIVVIITAIVFISFQLFGDYSIIHKVFFEGENPNKPLVNVIISLAFIAGLGFMLLAHKCTYIISKENRSIIVKKNYLLKNTTERFRFNAITDITVRKVRAARRAVRYDYVVYIVAGKRYLQLTRSSTETISQSVCNEVRAFIGKEGSGFISQQTGELSKHLEL